MDLSVVIPARDVAATLADQLDALRAQRWEGEWEVVVVDNGSVDATVSIASEYADGTPTVRVVTAGERAGLSYARNVGVAAALSNTILICDGDDIVAEGWVAAMAAALERHEIATGPLETRRLNPPWLADSRGRVDADDAPRTFWGIFPVASGGNLGLTRQVWERLDGFAEDAGGLEDVDFSLRAWLAGIAVGFAPDAVLHYRYRTTGRELWRQGRAYGAGRPLICRRLREAGRATPPRLAGWRSWLWLVRNGHRLATRPGRAVWLWVAGNRIGQLEGALRHRALYL